MIKSPSRAIDVFRPGKFIALGGETCEFTADDLRAIASEYNYRVAPAPGVVGHPKTDDPAWCWAESFTFDEERQRLVARMCDVHPAFAEAVAKGSYKKISLSLFAPDALNNPKPGRWYPKHVGFLGAAAPAVSGLAPVSFASDDGAVTFEFADASALRDVAGLFQSLREWMIEQFGSEPADKALSRWTIDWIAAAAERPSEPVSQFSATTEDNTMTDKTTGGPTAEELAARAADLDKRERALVHDHNVSFTEGLVSDGRLIPAMKAKVVGLLDFAAIQRGSVEFAEGAATATAAPSDTLREVLSAMPKAVTFGKVTTGDVPARSVEFAAPDGATVDAVGLDLHHRAVAFQAAHPNTEYLAAVRAVEQN